MYTRTQVFIPKTLSVFFLAFSVNTASDTFIKFASFLFSFEFIPVKCSIRRFLLRPGLSFQTRKTACRTDSNQYCNILYAPCSLMPASPDIWHPPSLSAIRRFRKDKIESHPLPSARCEPSKSPAYRVSAPPYTPFQHPLKDVHTAGS